MSILIDYDRLFASRLLEQEVSGPNSRFSRANWQPIYTHLFDHLFTDGCSKTQSYNRLYTLYSADFRQCVQFAVHCARIDLASVEDFEHGESGLDSGHSTNNRRNRVYSRT